MKTESDLSTSSRPRRGWVSWVVLGLACLGGMLLIGMCGRVAERGRFAAAYSTHSAGADGARALFLVTQAEGYKAHRWSRELVGMPQDAVLVVLGGCESRFHQKLSRFEREALVRFLEEGGTLLVAGASRFLFEALPVSIQPPAFCGRPPGWVTGAARFLEEKRDLLDPDSPEEADPNGASPESGELEAFDDIEDEDDRPATVQWARAEGFLAGLGSVPLYNAGQLEVDAGVPYDTLLALPDAAAAIDMPYEAGRLIVLSSASLFQNSRLDPDLGGLVFARLLHQFDADQPVLFDELHLGVGQRRSMIQYFRAIGGDWLGLQALLIFVAVLLRVGARFGRAAGSLPALPGGTRPFLTAMAELYRGASDPIGTVRRLKRHALHRVAAHHHLESANPKALLAFFRARGREDVASLVNRIHRESVLPSSNVKEVLRCARRLESLVLEATTNKQEGIR